MQLTTQPGMTCDELKRAIVVSSTYLTSDMERRDETAAFQSRTDGTKASTGLDNNQCPYCLIPNHRWQEYRSYPNGKTRAERPPGMSTVRKFPSPQQDVKSNGREDISRLLMAMNVVVEDERILEQYREVSMFTSADSHTDCLRSKCPHDSLERGSQEHA